MKIVFLIIGSLLVLNKPLYAQEQPENKEQIIQLFSIDYMDGIQAERATSSYHLNLAYGKYLNKNVALFGQLVLAQNSGHSVTWRGGTASRQNADASGIGLSVLARWHFYQSKKINLASNGSVGVIYFNKEFPPQGSRLNFLLKLGLNLGYRLSQKASLEIGVKYMHISNGKGYSYENPSLDAIGPSIGLIYEF